MAESVEMMEVDVQNRLREMGFEVTAIVHNRYELFKAIDDQTPDIVLTDIHLDRKDEGIKVVDILDKKYNIPTIFLSGETDYKIIRNAMKKGVYGFVSKPFDQIHLFGSIQLAVDKYKKNQANAEKPKQLQPSAREKDNNIIFVRSNYKVVKINLLKVTYIESLKDYIGIHTPEQKVTVNMSMKKILKVLPEEDFCRVHKSYIIRMDKINYMKFPSLFLDGHEEDIPVGGLYKDVLFERMQVII